MCRLECYFVVRVCIRSLIYCILRVDDSLADGVYELVAEQEGGDQQPSEIGFGLEQDPNQSSVEPKAAEGKHRTCALFENEYPPRVNFICALSFSLCLKP